ncbi:MAG: penicillin-binding protein 1C [Alicycliphilus sp.]|nr:MAG: penicillin-binding protein 1C [Alicycliphilus sp.]
MRPGAWAAGLALAAGPALALPSFDEVRADFRSSETLVLSREGEVIQRLRTDATVRRGQWLGLADVSPALQRALVLSEDRRFYEHSGVDWAAVSAAAWANLWHERTRGASTLTMQLAGLLDGDWRQGPGGRTVTQKMGQAVAAQLLERRWRKDQILEAYLNLVPFRGELVGIDALARTLFGKAAHGLDERESAVAAALVRAPNARPALVARRACGVLRDMQQGQADCEAVDLFTTAALQRRAYDASAGIAPHFARQWLRGGHGAGQRSSLSAPLQRMAQQTLQRHLRELAGRNVQDAALVVLDNASGEVLAWVGSSGPLSQAAEVDGVLALRQPGSTLKPFLYAQAIAEKRLTAASLLHDSPAQIATAGGLYIPQNYDRQFKGWVSVRQALGSSLNVPAVRSLVMVSPDAFFAQLRRLGLALRESGGYYGYSLALGSSEVRLLELANAYRALANGGRVSPVAYAPGARAAFIQALDAGAAFIVGDILADANARVPTFGSDSVLNTRFWSAVKTGTSKDMRDNWAMGWSARYTVGVWVGNAGGSPMHDVSGSSGAAPIWADVMAWLHRGAPSHALRPPAGVLRQPVRFDGGADRLESPREEWFVRGTQQAVFAIDIEAPDAYIASASGKKHMNFGTPARIIAPAPGSIIALDPDIPPAHQRLQLQAQGGTALRWRIDGRPVGQGAALVWLPWPGRHRVELLDAQGQMQDSVQIEVRGAGVKPGPGRPGGAGGAMP